MQLKNLWSLIVLTLQATIGYASHLDQLGCSQTVLQGLPGSRSQQHQFTSVHGGGRREYLLYLPLNYKSSEPNPLIIALHGHDQTARAFENETQFSDADFNDDTIVVYPQGLNNQWTGDPASPPPAKLDDRLFIDDLLTHLTALVCVDKNRIYAFGFSNGGGLVDLLACRSYSSTRSADFAAYAATSAAIYTDAALKLPLFSNCPARESPIPWLEFHGTADPVIAYDGTATPDGPTYPIAERMGQWAERNGCPPGAANTTTLLFDERVQRYSWTCDGRVDVVVHYRIEDFEHGVPSSVPVDNDDQRFGPTYFNATSVAMDFFKAWSLGMEKVGLRDEL